MAADRNLITFSNLQLPVIVVKNQLSKQMAANPQPLPYVNPIRTLLLNLYFWPLFALTTLVYLLLIPTVAGLAALKARDRRARLYRRGVQSYGRVLIRLIPFFAPVELENRAGTLPPAAIFVPNHSSSVDPFCFAVLREDFAFLTSWPFDLPFFRGIMRQAGYIDTRSGWEEVRRQGLELLADGCSLVIWPEGHRSRDGRLGPFQRGAFHLACETGRPLVPVCIVNSGKLLPPGRRLLRPARPQVILLPPVWPTAASEDRKYVKELSRTVRQQLAAELDRHRTDA